MDHDVAFLLAEMSVRAPLSRSQRFASVQSRDLERVSPLAPGFIFALIELAAAMSNRIELPTWAIRRRSGHSPS